MVECRASLATPVKGGAAAIAPVDPPTSSFGFGSPRPGVLGSGGVPGTLVGEVVGPAPGAGFAMTGVAVEADFEGHLSGNCRSRRWAAYMSRTRTGVWTDIE